jgi:hypothetical protein
MTASQYVDKHVFVQVLSRENVMNKMMEYEEQLAEYDMTPKDAMNVAAFDDGAQGVGGQELR